MIRRLCIAALVLAAAVTALPVPTRAAALCAIQYRDSLIGVRSAVAAGETSRASAALDTLAGSANAESALRPLRDDLATANPDLTDAARRLDAIIDVLALPPNAVCGADVSAARSALRDVYASPAFANLDQSSASPSAGPSAPVDLSGLTGFSRVAGPLLVVLTAAAALALAAFLVIRQMNGVRGDGGEAAEEPAGAGSDPREEWLRAEVAANAGQYREAVRRAFRGALLDVALAGRLTVSASWTSRELLAQSAGDADLMAALAGAADAFDRAWYAGRAVTGQDWGVARDRCRAVSRLASRARVGVSP